YFQELRSHDDDRQRRHSEREEGDPCRPHGRLRHWQVVKGPPCHAHDPQICLSAVHSAGSRNGDDARPAASLLIAATRAFVSGWFNRIFIPGSVAPPILSRMTASARASPPALFMRPAP